MGYKPTLILFLISLLSSFEGFAADLNVFRPYDRGNIGNWVRVPEGVNMLEVIGEVRDRVGGEYKSRIDEIPRTIVVGALSPGDSHSPSPKTLREVFLGYDYPPCAPFDGGFLHGCYARSEASSDVNVLLFGSVRAGDLYWKVPFTGVETAYLPCEVGLRENLEGLGDFEFFDNARISSEPEEMFPLEDEEMFPLEDIGGGNSKKETPVFSVQEHLKIIKTLDEVLVDIIAAPHKIDTMTADDTEDFLREMFAHLKEGGEIHLLWKYFQKPGDDDQDYKIFGADLDNQINIP